jgi:hypothetical protein
MLPLSWGERILMHEKVSVGHGPAAWRLRRYVDWPVRYWIVFASTVFAAVAAWELFDLFTFHGQPSLYPSSFGNSVVLILGLLGEALLLMAIALLVLEACLMLRQSRRSRATTA